PGKVDALTHVVDWMPTLTKLAGCKPDGGLKWDGIDEEKYKALSAQGMGHHQIMRQLHEEMQG
ncbi:MAG: hypothetical protein ACPHO6_02480, partial [Candidatus Latescibacterota bacterium]